MEWFRPEEVPTWLTAAGWAALPRAIRVRELRYTIARPGFRVRTVTLVTSLLDAQRYQTVLERFPDFAHVNRARYGLALTHYRKGDYDKSREVLETISGPDRSGDLR